MNPPIPSQQLLYIGGSQEKRSSPRLITPPAHEPPLQPAPPLSKYSSPPSPRQNRQPSMQCPLIPPPTLQQIHPKHRVPLHRPKRQPALPRRIAIHNAFVTPPPINRRIQPREIRPAARRAFGDVHVGEEGAHPVAADGGRGVLAGREPVRVEVVVLCRRVFDELEGLEVGAGRVVALEG
jgi:hypothetical protein